jgi:hypothetical protein
MTGGRVHPWWPVIVLSCRKGPARERATERLVRLQRLDDDYVGGAAAFAHRLQAPFQAARTQRVD